ncbi:MAG: alkane 1-monooxygenase [Isosphaeraceae bacterium]
MGPYAAFGYLLSLLPALLAVAGNLKGGPWTLATTGFVCALIVADWFAKEDTRLAPDRPEWTPDLVLALHVLVHTLAVATLLEGIASGRLPAWRARDAALSTGLSSGVCGIVAAHELIHRRARGWRLAGWWNLLLVNYTHFAVEHVQGHHKHVGTRSDPSTARLGESLYGFLVRSIPQQFACALSLEARRLRQTGRAPFGVGNRVVLATAAQVLIAAGIGLSLGKPALAAFLWQGLIAVTVLQTVNYLQHYGLERVPGTRIEPAHSWESDRISGRLLLLELPRHADHHCHSTRPYQRLEASESSPLLPFGLLGTVPLLLIPPLWFAVARRAVERSQGDHAGVSRADAATSPRGPHAPVQAEERSRTPAR